MSKLSAIKVTVAGATGITSIPAGPESDDSHKPYFVIEYGGQCVRSHPSLTRDPQNPVWNSTHKLKFEKASNLIRINVLDGKVFLGRVETDVGCLLTKPKVDLELPFGILPGDASGILKVQLKRVLVRDEPAMPDEASPIEVPGWAPGDPPRPPHPPRRASDYQAAAAEGHRHGTPPPALGDSMDFNAAASVAAAAAARMLMAAHEVEPQPSRRQAWGTPKSDRRLETANSLHKLLPASQLPAKPLHQKHVSESAAAFSLLGADDFAAPLPPTRSCNACAVLTSQVQDQQVAIQATAALLTRRTEELEGTRKQLESTKELLSKAEKALLRREMEAGKRPNTGTPPSLSSTARSDAGVQVDVYDSDFPPAHFPDHPGPSHRRSRSGSGIISPETPASSPGPGGAVGHPLMQSIRSVDGSDAASMVGSEVTGGSSADLAAPVVLELRRQLDAAALEIAVLRDDKARLESALAMSTSSSGMDARRSMVGGEGSGAREPYYERRYPGKAVSTGGAPEDAHRDHASHVREMGRTLSLDGTKPPHPRSPHPRTASDEPASRRTPSQDELFIALGTADHPFILVEGAGKLDLMTSATRAVTTETGVQAGSPMTSADAALVPASGPVPVSGSDLDPPLRRSTSWIASHRLCDDPRWLQSQLQGAWQQILAFRIGDGPVPEGVAASMEGLSVRGSVAESGGMHRRAASHGSEPGAMLDYSWRSEVLQRAMPKVGNKRLLQAENEFLMRLLMAAKARLATASECPGQLPQVLEMLDKLEIGDVPQDDGSLVTC